MIIYIYIIILLMLIPWQVNIKGFNSEYLSRSNTTALKGILCLIVLISHYTQNDYYPLNRLDYAYLSFKPMYDQLVMAVPFFYSAYGVTESIKSSGFSYIRRIPVKRILKVFVIYDLAQIMFLFVNRYAGISYSLKDIVLSFVGWHTIGSDNWFIFTLFAMYAFSWVSFRMYRENYVMAAAAVTVETLGLILVLYRLNRDPYWYDVLMAYPLGIWFSLYRERIEKQLFQNSRYYPVLITLAGVFAVVWIGFHDFSSRNQIVYEFCSCLWMVLVVLFSMKVNLANPVLYFLGKNLFGFYLMHRIVLLLLPRGGIFIIPYLRFIVFILITAILSWIFNTLADRLSVLAVKKISPLLYPSEE